MLHNLFILYSKYPAFSSDILATLTNAYNITSIHHIIKLDNKTIKYIILSSFIAYLIGNIVKYTQFVSACS